MTDHVEVGKDITNSKPDVYRGPYDTEVSPKLDLIINNYSVN